MNTSELLYNLHLRQCPDCAAVDKGTGHGIPRCHVGRDLVRITALENQAARAIGATHARVDWNPPRTEQSLRRFISQNCKRGNRDLFRGLALGRYEQALGADKVIEVFGELWPKYKPRITAADFILLRDMKVSL